MDKIKLDSKMKNHGLKYILKDGSKAVSVTTVINNNLGWNKNVLIGWTKKQTLMGVNTQEILRDAGDIGTLAHFMVEKYEEGFEVDAADYTANQIKAATLALSAYVKWRKAQKDYKILKQELTMVSEKLRIGGACDVLARLNGELVIIDYKTSRYIYPEVKAQLGCYAHMYEELQPKAKIVKGIALRLDKETGEYEQHEISRENLDRGFKLFKLLLKVDRLKKYFK